MDSESTNFGPSGSATGYTGDYTLMKETGRYIPLFPKGSFKEAEEEKDKKKGDIPSMIKTVIETKWGGSNEEQMRAVQLMKGLATSDDPKANKFMKALDSATSNMDPKDFE